MNNNSETDIKVIKTKIPKVCVCPTCGKEQPFKKDGSYLTRRKDLSLGNPVVVIVERIRAKCLNPSCKIANFVLPILGIEKYQRAISRVKEEVINRNVLENVTYRRISRALNYSFNLTGSKSSIDRWKQKEANKYSFQDIIKAMGFSGVLSIDEYKPSRSDHYSIIAADARKVRILYTESARFSPRHAGTLARGDIEGFCCRLKGFGINPYAVIVDLLKAYPKQIKKVWPDALIQFDYFHVQQAIHKHLKQFLFGFIRQTRKDSPLAAEELWEHRWRILRNMEKWSSKDHEVIPKLMETYANTPVEQILLFKEHLYDIFDRSQSKEEAYRKRDILFNETWWRNSWHLTQAIRFLMRPDFEYMVTYLDNPEVPRCGNIETLIRTWRQMEKVRYGFSSEKGRQNHLKLYQVKHYLKNKVAQNSGQLQI
jgi:transposase